MQTNPYQAYIETEILTSDPLKLVQLLYRGALDAVAEARMKLAQGDIGGRNAAAMKTFAILAELSASLDHEKGGELSARLAALYDYMQRQLLEGNHTQTDSPFAEVEQLLNTLADAWLNIDAQKAPEQVQTTPEPVQTIPEHAAQRVPEYPRPVRRAMPATMYEEAPSDYVPLSCTA